MNQIVLSYHIYPCQKKNWQSASSKNSLEMLIPTTSGRLRKRAAINSWMVYFDGDQCHNVPKQKNNNLWELTQQLSIKLCQAKFLLKKMKLACFKADHTIDICFQQPGTLYCCIDKVVVSYYMVHQLFWNETGKQLPLYI